MADEVKPQGPAHTYLRLLNIYRSDIRVEDNKVVDSILIHCEDMAGNQFIMPVYVKPLYIDSVIKNLKRLSPLVFSAQDEADLHKTEPTQDLHNIQHEPEEGTIKH